MRESSILFSIFLKSYHWLHQDQHAILPAELYIARTNANGGLRIGMQTRSSGVSAWSRGPRWPAAEACAGIHDEIAALRTSQGSAPPPSLPVAKMIDWLHGNEAMRETV
ncbi:hypothetical protein [Mesorhizobium sp.]|uniref:hypothetical protein n=1 Tax=Mesorhizobium sp. TaxID=1871066 RepID=UPI00257ECF66|nr:hypothetical protein [Mesorhizobium sp.]